MTRLRGAAVSLVTLVGLTLGPQRAQAAAPAQTTTPPQTTALAQTTASAQTTAPSARLSVEPESGVSGTLVTITSDVTQTPTVCTLEQDGTFQQTFPCGPKSTIQFTVIGAPGRHRLTVCAPACIKVAAAPTATAVFVVLAVVSPSSSAQVRSTVRSRGGRRLVAVPDIRGQSLDDARAALAGVGLVMLPPSSSGTVATQSPPPGERVAAGTAVTVTTELTASPTLSTQTPDLSPYWPIAVAVLVLLALAGGFTARRLHRRRVRHHRPNTDPAAGPPPRVTCRARLDIVHTEPTGPAARTIDLRIREHLTVTMERKP